MTNFTIRAMVALTLMTGIQIARGAMVTEIEANGAGVNNSIVAAQSIPNSAFTTPVPGSVFNPPGYSTATVQGSGGFNDVDFFRFFSFGGQVYIDMDNAAPVFDPMLALFDSTGTLLAFADDSDIDDGSVNTIDPFLGVLTLPGPGEYFIAISENPNFPAAAFTGTATQLNRPDGLPGGFAVSGAASGLSTFDFDGVQPGNGDYLLNISSQNVPEPQTFMLLGCGLGLMASFLRRHSRSRNSDNV